MSTVDALAGRSLGAEPALEPVPGPGAVGGGWRRFLNLLWVMSATDFKQAFHGTVFGYLWYLARPLLTFGVLLAVFTQVFKLGQFVESYPAMLLLNIMLFALVAESTGKAVTSMVTKEGVVRKTQFPRLVIPLSVVLTELLNLGLNLIAVFIFIIAYGLDPIWTWVMLPVLVGALFIFALAMSMLLSALFPRFRDVALIWSVMIGALFYATPVLYPINSAPPEFQDALQFNPLAPIFEQAHEWIIDPTAPGAIEATAGKEWILATSIAIYVAICVLAVIVFKREAPRIAEAL